MKTPDPIANLTRTLAEVNLEAETAAHDYRRTLEEGSDFMASRYPASMLNDRPQDLDHYAFHMEALHAAKEKGGIGDTPSLPFQPARTEA